MSKFDEEIVEWLKRSREQVGELEPVYMTADGEVIDGKHRLKAYPGWKTQTIRVEGYKKVVERVHRNIHRRVSKAEVKEAIIQLALALEKAGTPREQLIDEIKKVMPFTEEYIRSLLPAKFKRKYEHKEKLPVRTLVETPKPATVVQPPPQPKYFTCPVCASKLVLKGDVLVVV